MTTARKVPRKTAKSRPATARKTAGKSGGFSQAEREAMKERLREMKSESGRGPPGAADDGESEVLAKIAAFAPADRALAGRIHRLIRATAPQLVPRTWYGMPAYARDGQVVCFFQNASKFKTRYATLGFSDKAKLDEGRMWPTTYALREMGDAEEARIAALVKKAVG